MGLVVGITLAIVSLGILLVMLASDVQTLTISHVFPAAGALIGVVITAVVGWSLADRNARYSMALEEYKADLADLGKVRDQRRSAVEPLNTWIHAVHALLSQMAGGISDRATWEAAWEKLRAAAPDLDAKAMVLGEAYQSAFGPFRSSTESVVALLQNLPDWNAPEVSNLWRDKSKRIEEFRGVLMGFYREMFPAEIPKPFYRK